MLQRAGIAWPGQNIQTPTKPQSFNNVLHDAAEALDMAASSRSSSGYPFVPASSYSSFAPPPPYPASLAESALKKPQTNVRLSSDQLQMILAAVSPSKQADVAAAVDRATSVCFQSGLSRTVILTYLTDEHAATATASACHGAQAQRSTKPARLPIRTQSLCSAEPHLRPNAGTRGSPHRVPLLRRQHARRLRLLPILPLRRRRVPHRAQQPQQLPHSHQKPQGRLLTLQA